MIINNGRHPQGKNKLPIPNDRSRLCNYNYYSYVSPPREAVSFIITY